RELAMRQDEFPQSHGDNIRPLAWGLVLVAAVAATLLRLLPYMGLPWLFNFTVVGALGLYGGARLPTWQAFGIPLLPMAASDLTLRTFVPFLLLDRLPVYGCFLVYVLLGRTLLSRSESPLRIGGVALLGSLQFFLITNFLVYLSSTVDPATIPDGAAW